MPARRTTTTTSPTPIEETEPTAPASPVEPAPEPEPQSDEQRQAAASLAADDLRSYDPDGDGPPNVVDDVPPETMTELEERIGRMIDAAMQERRPGGVFNLMGWPLGAAKSAAAAEGDYPLTVHEAIAEVTRLVGHIAKDRQTEGGERYKFRGIDDVLAALHPILGDVGLVILPGRMMEHRRETRSTARGGTLNVALVLVRYTLVGPDGTKLRGEAWGEAGDSGDKATQKALSQAYKTFALQTFSIPTEESRRDDPDVTNEPSWIFTEEQTERAGKAYVAAQAAGSLEELVGVRRRALELLAVPVSDRAGRIAPLTHWLDLRRGELEGVTG